MTAKAHSLEGLRVVDLSQNLAGPVCTRILADLGADVIKVEPPGGDSARAWGPPFWGGESPLFLVGNRNKRSLTLDLKDESGKRALRSLVGTADVFVQSLRAGVVERLGFGYEEVRRIRPDVIYVSVTAYGPDGPLSHLPGYDPLMQAHSGLMSITGDPSTGPSRTGASVVDISTGMWGAIGVLSALRTRERTGEGTHVVTSLLESALGLVSYHLIGYLATGHVPGPMGSGISMIVPYEAFPTTDGRLMIAAGNDATFRRLCQALDLDELADDPRFTTNPDRVASRQALVPRIAKATATRTTDELRTLLDRHAVPSGPINDVAQVVADPQVVATGVLEPADHPDIADYRTLHLPLRWNGERAPYRRPPPRAGEHTAEVLAELDGEPDAGDG
jgi:formyl-CoA transferase/CoA:oxalate CoA-transferase